MSITTTTAIFVTNFILFYFVPSLSIISRYRRL